MKLFDLFEAYTAFVLDDASRKKLKEKFPPKYPDFIGHHVTLEFGVPFDTKLVPEKPKSIEVVGYKNNPDGLEALVVAVDGETKRKDGSTYHITWSLDRSKHIKPVDSNKLLKSGFDKIEPIKIDVEPGIFK